MYPSCIVAAPFQYHALALVWVRASDPERAWRAIAEERLEPTDLVLTHSRAHLYLLGTRHGLEVELLPSIWSDGSPRARELEAAVERARRAGRRVVLDDGSLALGPESLVDEPTRLWAERAASAKLRSTSDVRR